jgi:hypothetical protein
MRCWRYIHAYSQGMDVEEAHVEVQKFTTKTYTSHRRLGMNDWCFFRFFLLILSFISVLLSGCI